MGIDCVEFRYKQTLADAFRSKDAKRVRPCLQGLARHRFPHLENRLALRIWETAFAYGEVSRIGTAKREIWHAVRWGISRRDPVGVVVWLQDWGKAHYCFERLTEIGLSDMTCEGVIVESPERFPDDMVVAAERLMRPASSVVDGSEGSTSNH